MPKLICHDAKPKVLPPVQYNVGIEVGYRGRLDRLLERMHKSLLHWLRAAYRANPPSLALDSPASDFIAELRGLGRRWRKRFDQMSVEIGTWFAKSTADRSDRTMKAILKDAGWTVEFRPTRTWNEIRQATIHANVSLIKSIGEEHLRAVEGIVMRSVQMGGDLGTLTKELERRYDLSRNRASLIARHQNQMATAAITRVRQQELGIEKAIWVHSHAGRVPRPKHVAFAAGKIGGPIYDISKGAPIGDDDEFCWPGQLINCRCISRSIIPGLGY